MTALTHLALSQEVQRLRAENLVLPEALGCISRMHTQYDHKANSFTLMAAHKLAEQALARCDVASTFTPTESTRP